MSTPTRYDNVLITGTTRRFDGTLISVTVEDGDTELVVEPVRTEVVEKLPPSVDARLEAAEALAKVVEQFLLAEESSIPEAGQFPTTTALSDALIAYRITT